MAWGISPRRTAVVPLGDYNADHYLTLLYHAMDSMGWHISYFDHDGIIAYTNISWESYSEEVSARVQGRSIFIKSECVGYQGLFTDYGKNKKNLELLFGEIDVRDVVLKDHIEETAQRLMDEVPEKQFVQLADPPMAGKEKLRSLGQWFVPQQKYLITPILVLINIAVYVVIYGAFTVIVAGVIKSRSFEHFSLDRIYLMLGYSGRSQVLKGETWRLLTSCFLHFSLSHLIGNMIVLVYIGSLIESKLGKWSFLCVYLCTGIVSGMVSVWWRDQSIAGGASGAIFGLFGVLLALLSTNFYERSARRALLISTAIFVAYSILPIGRNIDHAAHFGGLLCGYLFGLLAYVGLKYRTLVFNPLSTSVASLLVTAGIVVLGLHTIKDYQYKEFTRMIMQSEKYNRTLYSQFYDNNDKSHDEKLVLLTNETLPEISKYNRLSDSIARLTLPGKKKKEAVFRSQIIKLQCRYFRLLYMEFKDKTPRYRAQITTATDSINSIRLKWGKEVD